MNTTTYIPAETMSKTTRFWDRIADRYAAKPVADEAVYQKKLDITRTYFRPDMEVLEIGCGTGSTAIAHAPYVNHIRATDFSHRMIEIARAKLDQQKIENVTFEQIAIDDLQIPDGSVDAVMAHSILHLVEDMESVVQDVFRGLKPGGVFISSTVCIGDMLWAFKYILPVGRRLGLIPLVKVFTASDLEAVLTRAGFEIDKKWLPGKNKAIFIIARKPG